MAVLEFMVAGEFTALGFTVAADFQAAGSTVGLAVSTGELLDLPTADFTTANFKLTDFTARGSIIVASTAAWSWPLPSVGCGWAPGWAALITLFQTKATTATDRIPSTGTATTLRGITPYGQQCNTSWQTVPAN
jgi:hypothetical protein